MKSVTFENLKKQNYTMKESLRALKTNIQFCGDDICTIVVTSAMPNEGKSTVTMDLARSFSESGKRVLLIDTDMRKSVYVGRLRAVASDGREIYGLSHFLSGQKKLEDVLYGTTIPGLFMIFAGPSVPNPTEILEKKYFTELLNFAKEHFDYVLLDCAPIGAAIDAAVIAKHCDGAILVIAQGMASGRLIYALYDYKAPLKLSQCQFVGLKWFKTLFSNKTQVMQLIQVMKNTFAMSLLGIATSFLPVLFAVFLNEIKCKWFKNLVQTLTTLPNFISWTLVYSIAFCLFSTTGMFNTVMQNLGVISEPLKILDSGRHVWLQMILWSTWKGLGWGAIMYLAAIAGIDQEMYDAAKVDGAGRFQIIKNITIPSIMPTYFVMLMLSVANFLNNGMDQYFVFQNAFNKSTIQVLDLYVYNIGMTGRSLSLATAIGILKSIVSVTLLAIVNFVSKKTRGESMI